MSNITNNNFSMFQHLCRTVMELEPMLALQDSAKRLIGWTMAKVNAAQAAPSTTHPVHSRYARHRSLGYQPVQGETYAVITMAVQYDDIIMLDVICVDGDRERTSAFPVPTRLLLDGPTKKRFRFNDADELLGEVIKVTTGLRRRDAQGMLYSPIIKVAVLKQ